MSKHIVLVLMVIAQVWGNVWLSRGMRQVGSVHASDLSTLMELGLRVLTNPSIVLGAIFLIGSLVLYLIAVSRLDLSYVLPLTASKYVLSALFAWLILNESVSELRWFGTVLISAGVVLVSVGERMPPKAVSQSQNGNHFALLPLAVASLSLTLAQIWLAIIVMVLAASAGDILMAAGMKQVGTLPTFSWQLKKRDLLRSLLQLVRRAMTSPLVGLGVLCMAVDFFLFIALLSRADLSLIMPLTALSYPMSILGSHYFLKERLTSGRVVASGLIGIGVALISLSANTH